MMEKEHLMKTQNRIAVLTLSLLVLAVAFVRSTPGVGAAATGQIVGTVKLDGQAPHQKPIDMSKGGRSRLERESAKDAPPRL